MAYHTKIVSFISNWVDGYHGPKNKQNKILTVNLTEPVTIHSSGTVQITPSSLPKKKFSR